MSQTRMPDQSHASGSDNFNGAEELVKMLIESVFIY